MHFSLLISIYKKEKVEYFHRCMQSIWEEQTLKPDEIVLVQDGPLAKALHQEIAYWKDILSERLKIIVLENNVGLGDALNIGIKHCTYDIVARMDTDDIVDPQRFAKQIDFLKKNLEIDIVGSWISEFEEDEKSIVSYRNVPELHQDILNFSKKRNPINHPSVMYSKNAVVEAGNYRKMPGFEDYDLWVRMLMKGSQFYNIQESLVGMRAGYGQLERRSGFKYAMNELSFQQELLQLGFINHFEFIRNITIRFISRIVPKGFVKLIYKMLRD